MTRRRVLISGLALLAIFATAVGPRLYRNMNPPPISPNRSAHLRASGNNEGNARFFGLLLHYFPTL